MENSAWEYRPNAEIPAGQSLPDGVSRIAMNVEYDGSAYSGWQRQKHSLSIQATVETVLSQVANQPITTICAGRTDAGVSASAQVIHFDTSAERIGTKWQLGMNSNLPDDIAITWVKQVSPRFHARFSATSRTYRYVIFNRPYAPAILNKGLTWIRAELDLEKVQKAIKYIVGTHDFSSFRAARCQSHSPVRNIYSASIERHGSFTVLEITANAFLHHMVRNIAGQLIEIGRTDLSAEHMQEILSHRKREKAAPTASPKGLYLVEVEYPSEFSLPLVARGPIFL